jgi:FMN-dependent NADH-azoreductase
MTNLLTFLKVTAFLWETTIFYILIYSTFAALNLKIKKMSSKKILQLNSSIMGEQSYSRKLGNAIVEKIQEKYPNSTVEQLDLVDSNIPHLTPDVLGAMFTPAEHQTDEVKQNLALSDKLVKQLFDADIIVIGAPLINRTIHSSLKAWIDHITRRGITFGYSAEGLPMGFVSGKKVYVAMSSGGVYTDEHGKANDFQISCIHLSINLAALLIMFVSNYIGANLILKLNVLEGDK